MAGAATALLGGPGSDGPALARQRTQAGAAAAVRCEIGGPFSFARVQRLRNRRCALIDMRRRFALPMCMRAGFHSRAPCGAFRHFEARLIP
jgi:hypothetical protein